MQHGVLSEVKDLGHVERNLGRAFDAGLRTHATRASAECALRFDFVHLFTRLTHLDFFELLHDGQDLFFEGLVCHLAVPQVDLIADEDNGDLWCEI